MWFYSFFSIFLKNDRCFLGRETIAIAAPQRDRTERATSIYMVTSWPHTTLNSAEALLRHLSLAHGSVSSTQPACDKGTKCCQTVKSFNKKRPNEFKVVHREEMVVESSVGPIIDSFPVFVETLLIQRTYLIAHHHAHAYPPCSR